MDAIGLASNIIQFVDFGTKLVHSTYEIYTSTTGSSAENNDLRSIAETIQRFSKTLHKSSPLADSKSDADKQLGRIAQSCEQSADELLTTLNKLRTEHPNRKWGSFSIALKTVWKQKKINTLEKRLESWRSALLTGSVAILVDDRSSVRKQWETQARGNDQMGISRPDQLHRLEQAVEDLENLQSRITLADVATQFEDLRLISEKDFKDRRILGSLAFSAMKIRQADITEAHARTFRWILEPRSEDGTGSTNFVSWLQTPRDDQNGICWIAGKPGSGKSTLMKFISTREETIDYLESWSGSNNLVTASFYFWNSGTTLQKSQEGLFRSLLFTVLRQCPEAISHVCSDRYDSITDTQWTLADLRLTLAKLASSDLMTTTKFCFFIDGLDEYNGHHGEMVDNLTELAKCSNIKLCVSSRQWTVFQERFDRNTTFRLYLQDLTRQDIASYVQSTLEENTLFRQARDVSSSQPVAYNKFVSEIVERAEGVFLWVFLVVRSLIDGLTNRDDIADLQRRLDQLPSDLESFFRHILDSIEPEYRVKAAHTLRMALASDEPLLVLTYYFSDQVLAQPDIVLPAKIREPPLDVKTQQGIMQKRIEARCKGLLESTREPIDAQFHLFGVVFLHRTVRDFMLETSDVQCRLLHMSNPGFDPLVAICQALLLEAKECWSTPTDPNRFPQLLLQLIDTAKLVQPEANAELNGILFELESMLDLNETFRDLMYTLTRTEFSLINIYSSEGTFRYPSERLLHLYLYQDFTTYAVFRMREPVGVAKTYDPTSLLQTALERSNSPDLVKTLIERGANPDSEQILVAPWSKKHFQSSGQSTEAGNDILEQLLQFKATKAWLIGGRILRDVLDVDDSPDTDNFDNPERLRALEILLENGADPNSPRVKDEQTLWTGFLEQVMNSRIKQDFSVAMLLARHGAALKGRVGRGDATTESIEDVIISTFNADESQRLIRTLRDNQRPGYRLVYLLERLWRLWESRRRRPKVSITTRSIWENSGGIAIDEQNEQDSDYSSLSS